MNRKGYRTNLSNRILSLAVVACLSACATDDGPREVLVVEPAWTAARAGAGAEPVSVGTRPKAPAADPFAIAFPGLISQTVRWASVDVRIVKAQQLRGASGDADADSTTILDPNEIYVRLDLEIANKAIEEVVYQERSTWDLKLASGTRLTSANPLGVSVLPGDQATAVVYYRVAEVIDLRGAALLLEGSVRGELEPEVLPLDAAYVQQFPRRLNSLVGKEASYRASSLDGQVHVDEAAYDVNAGRLLRANRDKRYIWLKLAYTDFDTGGYLSLGDVRIVVDGRASPPAEYEHGSVKGNATKVFFVAFEIDKDATRFDLVLPNGSQPGDRLSVDLAADAVLATDIP